MAAKQSASVETTVETTAQELTLEQIMAQIRAPKTASVSLTDTVMNKVADSGEFLARLGAGVACATDNMKDHYAMEKERQLRRRAERILAFAQSQK